ncbi:hypothetical protein [Rhodohalobacter sp. 614A]|uniref:hypothetical protein n=1 Tax=Rhodohalobacter sp. 614A TaxID=2908649 RepID=UPI00351D21AD
MVVHFPIALLATAIFFDFISFFLPKEKNGGLKRPLPFYVGSNPNRPSSFVPDMCNRMSCGLSLI